VSRGAEEIEASHSACIVDVVKSSETECAMCDTFHDETDPHCSFCGKHHRHIAKLIAGPNGAYICNECVDLCVEIIDQTLTKA
jgi:hypothetical protein